MVVNTFVHDDDQIVYLTIDGEEIETTPWHPFYTDEGWEDAGDLQPGDLILSLDGDYGVVERIVIVDETQTMYDLDVETVDTFAVGDGAWVVHNCGNYEFEDVIPDDHPRFDDLPPLINGKSRNAGQEHAADVIPGGTGRAIAGHGTYDPSDTTFVVPEGTYIRLWWKPEGVAIYDRAARLIEAGKYSQFLDQFKDVYETRLRMQPPQKVWRPGQSAYNYLITPPDENIRLYKNSITVDEPTLLGDLIEPNMGCIDLAFCTVLGNRTD